MYRHFLLFLAGTCMASGLNAVSIESAFSEYRDTASWQTIGEWLTGNESNASAQIARSQADIRDGLYFTLRLSDYNTASSLSARIEVLRTGSKEMETFTLPITQNLERWLHLGLTGTDWPDSKAQPVAWKIQLIDPSGQTIAEWKSFLYEK